MTSPGGDKLRRPQNAPIAQGTPIGVQPGTQSITIAHIIIVTGPGGGVFIYSGTPGPGNPPTAWISNGTTDPYGNALPEGAQMGLSGSGTFAAGDTIITPSGEFAYSGTPGLGTLASSFVPGTAQVTDPFGNAALPGLADYVLASGTYLAVQMAVSGVAIWSAGGNPAGPYGLTGTGVFFQTQGVQISTITAHPILLQPSGTTEGTVTPAGLELVHSLILDSQGSTPAASSGNAVLYTAPSGYPKALGTTDANIYNTGRAVHDTFVPQTINSATAAQIDGLSHNVLSGQRYHYEAMVVYHGSQNAGAPIISLADPNTNTYTSVAAHEEWSVSGSAPSQTNTDLSFIDVTGPALTTGRFCYKSEGFFQPSANQTFNLFAACTVAADTWVVDAAYLILEPWT